MIVHLIITATGLFFFYSAIGLAHTYAGIILAHAMLGIPFVIITVTATLAGFNRSLTHAAASLSATPLNTLPPGHLAVDPTGRYFRRTLCFCDVLR